MKHVKTYNQINENNSESWRETFKRYGLPEDAYEEMEDYANDTTTVEIEEDPQVDGTWAVRVHRSDETFELLWHHGGFDEVDFETWPPISGESRFY